jgi:hypothetical protein
LAKRIGYRNRYWSVIEIELFYNIHGKTDHDEKVGFVWK